MNKRLRKKLRRAEFTEYGFMVGYRLAPEADQVVVDRVLDAFILEAIEAVDLSCGGGGGPMDMEFVVTAGPRRSATDADRQHVRYWLQSQPDIASSRVGTLFDAWNGDAEYALSRAVVL